VKTITELTDEETEWIESVADTLTRLGVAPDAAGLDGFLDSARTSHMAETVPVVTLVGVGIGRLLVETLGLRWVNVTNDRGTRLAVYGDSKKTLAFPIDAAARRWAGEPGSLVRYVAETTDAIVRLRAGRAA
jgi:hypothetical protein